MWLHLPAAAVGFKGGDRPNSPSWIRPCTAITDLVYEFISLHSRQFPCKTIPSLNLEKFYDSLHFSPMLKHRKVVRQMQTPLDTSKRCCPKQPHNISCQTSYIETMVSSNWSFDFLFEMVLPVMESRDLVSVSRPVFWSLGLEGFRSRSQALSLETLHRSFFMKFCKELLENGVEKWLCKIQPFKEVGG